MDFQISKLIQRCQTVGLTRVDTVGTFNNFSSLSKILCPASFHVNISRQLFNSYQEFYLSTINSYLFKFWFDSYFNGFVSLRVQVLSNCGLKTQRPPQFLIFNMYVKKINTVTLKYQHQTKNYKNVWIFLYKINLLEDLI